MSHDRRRRLQALEQQAAEARFCPGGRMVTVFAAEGEDVPHRPCQLCQDTRQHDPRQIRMIVVHVPPDSGQAPVEERATP